MVGRTKREKAALSMNKRFGIIRCFFVLFLGGLFSFFTLLAFFKKAARKKSWMAAYLTNESNRAHLESEAIAGDPEKQLRLGVICATGADGWTDHRDALFWFKKAAEQGDPNAQMLAAMMYLEGLGIRRNYKMAANWARLSALHGNVVSQLLMGVFLEDGAGMKRNLEHAASWYRQAANSPLEIGARQRLGVLYLEGKGVSQDIEEGLKWLNASAEMGDANACFQLGMIYYDGRLAERDYEKALDWYLKAAQTERVRKGEGAIETIFGPAAVPGEVYTRTVGQIMKRNPHVIRDAQFYVGLMYETGRGTEQDMEQSRNWYQKAADAGDEIARQRLVFLKDGI